MTGDPSISRVHNPEGRSGSVSTKTVSDFRTSLSCRRRTRRREISVTHWCTKNTVKHVSSSSSQTSRRPGTSCTMSSYHAVSPDSVPPRATGASGTDWEGTGGWKGTGTSRDQRGPDPRKGRRGDGPGEWSLRVVPGHVNGTFLHFHCCLRFKCRPHFGESVSHYVCNPVHDRRRERDP